MKHLSLVRLFPIVVFGLLSGCADDEKERDERVRKEFEEGPLQRVTQWEISAEPILEGLSIFTVVTKKKENKGVGGNGGLEDMSYNVERTDSLISPYVAVINLTRSTKTKLKGEEMTINMAYQNDKWVYRDHSFRRNGLEVEVLKKGDYLKDKWPLLFLEEE